MYSPSPRPFSLLSEKVLVVPHTHWDRAWYWPAERFRGKLCEVFAILLDLFESQPEFRFTLDGQCIPLLDVLEVNPGLEAALRRAAHEERFKVGPMYCLADLYCTGGEALIRNIQIGMEIARAFGGLQRTLHMPDTFGITPCIPMIAAGFDIPTFTFMRGVPGDLPEAFGMSTTAGVATALPDDTRMFVWHAPDGSSVRVMRLRDGYANAARIGIHPQPGDDAPLDLEKEADRLVAAARQQQKGEQGNPLLLLAGVDHQLPQSRLQSAMDVANARGEFHFHFAFLDEMAQAMGECDAACWPSYAGEFHGTGAASVLGGTVSTRVYLKQRNAEVEDLLINQAERAAAFAILLGRNDPSFPCLSAAWKNLLKTHPHDNICGCSVDAVHREDEHQMTLAWQAGDMVRRRAIINIIREFGANAAGDQRPSFVFFDSQGVPRQNPVEILFECEGSRQWGDIPAPRCFRIVDEAGNGVPFRELARGQSDVHPRTSLRLELHPKLRPSTLQRFYLEATRSWQLTPTPSANVIENEHLQVTVQDNGSFDLLDRRNGFTSRGLGLFSGQADVGDSYDFADIPSEAEEVFTSASGKVVRGNGCDGLQVVRWRGALFLPSNSNSTTLLRSRRKVRVPVTVEWSLAPCSESVQVRIAFTNTARNHRLRWNLALPGTPGHSLAGLPFSAVKRTVDAPPLGAKAPRIHPEHPAQHFVSAGDLALFTHFPINYEIVPGADTSPRLAVTLLRAVSHICQPHELTTRKGTGAGPSTPTPEAQCLGRALEFVFAVRPCAKSDKERLLHEALLWRCQPCWGQMDPTATYVEKKPDMPCESFFHMRGEAIVSSFKPTTDGKETAIRLFNPFAEPKNVELLFKEPMEVREANLSEEPVGSSRAVTALGVHLPPYGLKTFRISPGK